jgi:hypothetical protein
MLAKEQEPLGPWGEVTEPLEPIRRSMSTAVLAATFFLMCISEARVIHGLWFSPQPSLTTPELFLIPLSVFLPALIGVVLRVQITALSKKGQISLPAAAQLIPALSILLMVTYIAVMTLADYAFR